MKCWGILAAVFSPKLTAHVTSKEVTSALIIQEQTDRRVTKNWRKFQATKSCQTSRKQKRKKRWLAEQKGQK